MNEVRPLTDLRPASWATSHILRPDERLLIDSLSEYGWVAPLIVRDDGLIIDGNQRWRLATSEKKVMAKVGATVPVVVVPRLDEVDAMVMHIRLNRARGLVVAKRTSVLIHEALASRKYNEEQLRKMLGMTVDEFDVLYDAHLVKMKSVSQHQYSRAWVPIEAPKPGTVVAGAVPFERPLNRDN